jgi:hypothetical protein
MTKEELLEFASEITGGNEKDPTDEMQKLTTIMQCLSEFSCEEFKSFGQLCAIRADIDTALAASLHELVILRMSKEDCVFLLALIDRSIREHA